MTGKDINQGKIDALESTIKNIEKQFGRGAIMRLGENSHMNVEVISTGCMSLDLALGVGGLPRGRVVEIFGPESSGKTTVALHVIAQAQSEGGMAAFVDAEHALDPLYARKLGVDINNLLVAQPDSGEQALEIAEALVIKVFPVPGGPTKSTPFKGLIPIFFMASGLTINSRASSNSLMALSCPPICSNVMPVPTFISAPTWSNLTVPCPK